MCQMTRRRWRTWPEASGRHRRVGPNVSSSRRRKAVLLQRRVVRFGARLEPILRGRDDGARGERNGLTRIDVVRDQLFHRSETIIFKLGRMQKNVQPLLNFQIGFVKFNLINVLKNLVQEMCRSIEFLNFESGGKLTSSKVFLNWSGSRQCGIRSFSKKIYSKLKPVKLFVKHS
jgi:hypothetical protein